MSNTVKSFFEIGEITRLGRQVYQIVESGNPQGKYVIVDATEWEDFEEFRAAQQVRAVDVCPVCFGDQYLLHNDGLMHPCPACKGTGKRS